MSKGKDRWLYPLKSLKIPGGKKSFRAEKDFYRLSNTSTQINVKIAVSLVYANNGFDEKEIRIIFSFTTASTISGSEYN